MQAARELSLPSEIHYYPSFESGNQTLTDDRKIGIFFRSRDPFIRAAIEVPVSRWRYLQQRAESQRSPLYKTHVHPYPRIFNERPFDEQPIEIDKEPRRMYITMTYLPEYDDYERTYGNLRYSRWNLRALPGPPTYLSRKREPLASPTTNPVGYVNDVLNAFSVYYEPGDRLTFQEVLIANDLERTPLHPRYDSGYGRRGDLDIVGSLMEARVQRLSSNQLADNMRWLAERLVEALVFGYNADTTDTAD
jgi:hypothetical protein